MDQEGSKGTKKVLVQLARVKRFQQWSLERLRGVKRIKVWLETGLRGPIGVKGGKDG